MSDKINIATAAQLIELLKAIPPESCILLEGCDCTGPAVAKLGSN